MKLNSDLALEFFKENIQKIPIVKTIRDVTNQNQEYDMEIVLNNSERIFIDVKVFNNIYPRDINKIIYYKSSKNKKDIYFFISHSRSRIRFPWTSLLLPEIKT